MKETREKKLIECITTVFHYVRILLTQGYDTLSFLHSLRIEPLSPPRGSLFSDLRGGPCNKIYNIRLTPLFLFLFPRRI